MHVMSSLIKEKDEGKVLALTSGVWHGIKNMGGQMCNTEEMPWLLRKSMILFASHPPYFWAYLLEGKFGLIFKKGVDKLRKYIKS